MAEVLAFTCRRIIAEAKSDILCDVKRDYECQFEVSWAGTARERHFVVISPNLPFRERPDSILLEFPLGVMHVLVDYINWKNGLANVVMHRPVTVHYCDLDTYNLYRRSFNFECRHALEMADEQRRAIKVGEGKHSGA